MNDLSFNPHFLSQQKCYPLIYWTYSGTWFAFEACICGLLGRHTGVLKNLCGFNGTYVLEILILQTRELEIDNTALQVPSNGDQLLKVQRSLFFP
jgi:hypothetical protein